MYVTRVTNDCHLKDKLDHRQNLFVSYLYFLKPILGNGNSRLIMLTLLIVSFCVSSPCHSILKLSYPT